MSFEIEIIPMNEDNYTAVTEIEKQCFADRPWTKEQFFEELSLDFSKTFIAYSDGKDAGFVNMWFTPPVAIINNIAVLPDYRKMGIGSRLLESALGECRGCSSLTLEVRVSNSAAISMYEKYGFSVLGRRKNFYENPREDAFIMTKFLKKEMPDE